MLRCLALRWCTAFSLGMFAAPMAWADLLEERMKGCQWNEYDSKIAQFRENRARLPSAVEVSVKSCDAGGPTYKVKAAGKIATLQDVWKEGESTTHLFARTQPSADYWIFEYQGWEWSGTTFVHKKSARKAQTPGNSCEHAIFHPSGNRAVIRCSPEYGTEQIVLYLIALGPKLAFYKLQRNPPEGDLTIDWRDSGGLTARFSVAGKQVSVRTYRTPQQVTRE